MKQFLLYFGATVGFGVLAVGGVMLIKGVGSPEPIELTNNETPIGEAIRASPTNLETASEDLSTESTRPAPVNSTLAPEPMKPATKVANLASVRLPVLTNVSGKATRSILHHKSDRHMVRWFPNSDRVLVVLMSEIRPSEISVVEAESGKQLWNVKSRIPLRNAAVSADGSQVAIAQKGALVTVYDAALGKVNHKIPGPEKVGGTENVTGIRFDETGKQINTVHYDRTLRTWDIASKQELSRTSVAEAGTDLQGFSGGYLRTRTRKKIQWWDVHNSMPRLAYEVDRGNRLAEMSGDGRFVATLEGKNIAIKNVKDSKAHRTLELPLQNASSGFDRGAPTAPQRPAILLGGSFNSDGKRFAAFTATSRYLIWDVESGKLIRGEDTERRDLNAEYSHRLSPDGLSCLLPTDEGGFDVVDIESGKSSQLTPGIPIMDWRTTQTTAFSHDGDFQAVTLVGGAVEIRDTVEGKAVWSTERLTDVANTPEEGPILEFPVSDISKFAVSNDGQFTIVATHSGEVFVASRGQEPVVSQLATELEAPLAVALSPDDQYAIIATLGGGIVRIDVASTLQSQTNNAEILATIDDESIRCCAVTINADSTSMALGRVDGSIQLRSLTSFAEEATLKGGDGPVRSVAFSAEGLQVGCTTYAGTVYVWDTSRPQTPKSTAQWKESAEYISASKTIQFSSNHRPRRLCPIRFTEDGARLFVGRSTSIDVLNASTGERIDKLDIPEGPANLVLRTSDNRWLASRIFGEVYEWAPTVRESLVVDTGSKCRFVQFTPDGKTMIAGGEKGELNFIDATSGKVLHSGKTETGGALAGAISPDGTRLAICGYATGAEVWDIPSRKSLGKYYGHQARVHAVAFSPDSKLFASGSEDGTVRIREVATKKQTQRFAGHTLPPTTLAFSRDGKRLVSGTKNWKELDKNGILRIWDVATGKLLKSIPEPFGHIQGIGFSPFDQSIAVAVSNTMLTLQNIDFARATDKFSTELGLNHPRYLLHGRLLAFVEYPATIHVRDVLTGDELTKFRTKSMVFELATLPHGDAIAAACEDGTVHVWRLGK